MKTAKFLSLIHCICLILISVSTFSQKIIDAEYFIDSDPGPGNGTNIPISFPADSVSIDFKIPSQSISFGEHYLYVRVKDSLNKWSIYEKHLFIVREPASITPYNPILAPLVEAECFVDNDPGVGNGISIPISMIDSISKNFTIPTNSVSYGDHFLYVRVKDSLNRWSIYEKYFFIVREPIPSLSQSSISAPIVKAEYFVDNDPGIGNGTPLSGFANGLDIDFSINTNAINKSIGTHYLYIRVQDSIGRWSIYEKDTFEIVSCNVPQLDFTYTHDCFGSQTQLIDLSNRIDTGASYKWDIGNNGSVEYTTKGSVNHVFQNTGTFEVKLTITNTSICKDSIVKNVTIHPVDTTTLSSIKICNGDSAELFGQFQSQSGLYKDTLTSEYFCDSIIHQNLVVHPNFDFLNPVINRCSGQGANIFGVFRNTSGIYVDSSISQFGCDSVTTQELIIRPIYNDTISYDTICSNDSLLIFGNYERTTGFYIDSLNTNFSCDSVRVQYLHVKPHFDTTLNPVSVCQGNSTNIFGISRSIAGIYQDKYQKLNGCDSIFYRELIVNPNFIDSIPVYNVCDNDSIFLLGNYIKTSGYYVDSHLTNQGCDSLKVYQVEMRPTSLSSFMDTTCYNTPYVFPDGDTARVSKVDSSILFTGYGCDSVIVTDLFIDSVKCPRDTTIYTSHFESAVLVENIALRQVGFCKVSDVKFNIYGDTEGAGFDDASGRFFNVGVSGVQYDYILDNQESDFCYFTITVSEDIVGMERTNVDVASIQPNPSNGVFTIMFHSQLKKNYSILISDSKGNVVYQRSELNEILKRIDLSEIASGLYFLEIRNEDVSQFEKIVIQ